MSHEREGELQKRWLARYRKRDFHKGSPRDRAHRESQRLRDYRERLQHTL
ncbi:MAG: hypothetical protein AWU55_2352 [Halomonadaceae bacterium T82-2]|nr:MAG: hypothetical protein AWU55_2352 [Halomonadaceae bacterium T82-2]